MNYFRLRPLLAIFHPETIASATDSSQRPCLSSATSPGLRVDPIYFYRIFVAMLLHNLSEFKHSLGLFCFVLNINLHNKLFVHLFVNNSSED